VSNGINREGLDKFYRDNDEVNDFVKDRKPDRKTIDKQGKSIGELRYMQKNAEYRRVYYQWVYTMLISIVSICIVLILNISLNIFINKIIVSNGLYLFLLILIAIIVAISVVYAYKIKPRFDACQTLFLDLEIAIQTREMRETCIDNEKSP
jgi:hypothetical protein